MRRRITLVATVALVTGCTTVTVPPVKARAQYRAALVDTSRPVKERQRVWQEMKKNYPGGCGE
jgi:hypothetical protein